MRLGLLTPVTQATQTGHFFGSNWAVDWIKVGLILMYLSIHTWIVRVVRKSSNELVEMFWHKMLVGGVVYLGFYQWCKGVGLKKWVALVKGPEHMQPHRASTSKFHGRFSSNDARILTWNQFFLVFRGCISFHLFHSLSITRNSFFFFKSWFDYSTIQALIG